MVNATGRPHAEKGAMAEVSGWLIALVGRRVWRIEEGDHRPGFCDWRLATLFEREREREREEMYHGVEGILNVGAERRREREREEQLLQMMADATGRMSISGGH